jgi:DNA processing protein
LEQPFTSYQTKIQKSDIQIFLYSDERFPMELLTIPNTPFLIYVRGDLATTGTKIGMVGSRDATPYGEQVVTSFVPKLVQAGISIVSGGALGIDGLAHESTLKSK